MPVPSWKKTLYAIWAAELLAIAGFSTSTPIIPFYLQDLGVVDPGMVKLLAGLLQALPAVSLAILAPVWGSLADNYGRKPMLLRAMFGGTLVMILQGLVTDPWQLLALRTLQGCITGTVAAATVLVASISPKEEVGYALGLLQMAIFLGSSLGPMFGGLISHVWGHRITFYATAILLLAGGLITLRFADDDFSPPARRKSLLRSLAPDFSAMARSKALWALMAVVAADQVAGSIVSPFLGLFIQGISKGLGRVELDTGLIMGLGALSSALGAVLVGKASFRLGYQRTLIVCMLGAAAFTIPQAFASHPLQLLLLRIASSFFVGGNMPAANALISLRVEQGKQGSIYGLRSSVASASGAIGPAIGLSIAASAGYGPVFLATGAVLAGTGLAIGLFVRRSGPAEAG